MSIQGQNPDRVERVELAGSTDGRGDAGGRFAGFAGASANPRIQRMMAEAPERGTVMLILLGMAIGLITAYVIIPTEFTGASPRHLSQEAMRQWARMIAVGHSEAIHYDDANALIVLRQIPNPQGLIRNLANSANIPAAERAALNALAEIPGFDDQPGAAAPTDPGLFGSSLQVILSLAAVAIGAPILVIAGRTILPGRDASDAATRRELRQAAAQAGASSTSAGQAAEQYQAYAEAPTALSWDDDETSRGNSSHPQYGVAVLHALSNYVKGRNYDDSFAIELGPELGSQFLGECGVSAATQVGQELQSVEVWAFDMASQETLTKVFAAPAALGDPALQATLANRVKDPAADIIAAEPGATLLLDSGSIQVQATIQTVVCNYGGGSPNSAIETMRIELIAWRKQSAPSSLPASGYPAPAASPFNEYADLQFGAPAETTSPPPPPATGEGKVPRPSNNPLAPKRPEDNEDDPFGGTGNFMPYS